LLDAGLSVPTVTCLAVGDGEHWPGVTVSSAAHTNVRVACRKAILEQSYSGVHMRRLMLHGHHQIPKEPQQIRTFLDHALYYIPASKSSAFDFLRSGGGDPLSLSDLATSNCVLIGDLAKRLSQLGVRIAVVDVTSPDVARSPFRVVRALGTKLQPLHCGYGLERTENPRLRSMLSSNINDHPHPLC
jgi:ribosomal protein S12 methylthiotransferase accessory factor